MTPNRESLFRDIAQWVPSEQRQAYWEMVAHLQKLSPDDEILRVCQAMGVLALIARQVPVELGTQREAWQAACAEISTKLLTTSQEANCQSTELISKVSGLVEAVDVASEKVAQQAERVEKALREGADSFATEKLTSDVRAKLEVSVLKPAEEVVQRSAETFRKLEQGVPKLESIMRRVEYFSLRAAFRMASAVWAILSFMMILGIWVNLDGWYRTSLAEEVTKVNSRNATSAANLQMLNKLGKEIEVYPLEDSYALVLPEATKAYISTNGSGVIRFRKK